MAADSHTADSRVMETLAKEFPEQAAHLPAILGLLVASVPVPFIARYRKEKTGGVDEDRLREIRERHRKLLRLERRRVAILSRLEERGALDEELRSSIERAPSRSALGDLSSAHLPDARAVPEAADRERLGPLAAAIERGESGLSLAELSEPFLSAEKGIPDVGTAVDAVVSVMARRISDDPSIRGRIRRHFQSGGKLRSKLAPGADPKRKYETYHDFSQAAGAVPTHRVLAVLRGAREKALEVGIEASREKGLAILRKARPHPDDHPWKKLLERALEEAYDRLLTPTLQAEVLREMKERADEDGVRIFARNLRQLLLNPPAGGAVVMGVVPGVRRGCKIAVINAEGGIERHASVYPFADRENAEGAKKTEAARKTIRDFCRQYAVDYIGVGSGPGCREVERFIRQVIKDDGKIESKVVMVSEAGVASYSTGRVAKRELPKLDPKVRAAVALARKLKDPLLEMVKMEPRSISVGPYQRDVDQKLLDRSLKETVESCVALVGVDVNRADEHLLKAVPGLDARRARAIVAHRTEHGPFKSRASLKDVEGLDEQAWVVCSGFLAVRDGENPLDATRIHPSNYEIVEEMADRLGVEPGELPGNERSLAGLEPSGFAGEAAGLPTVLFVFDELRNRGADPRGVFEPPAFREDLQALTDLEAGMVLEGVVTNIASFGAFVDVGVDQEGLIHVSELADEFVDDPGRVVAVGERIKVRVLAVDEERGRLSLSRRTPGVRKPRSRGAPGRSGGRRKPQRGGEKETRGKGRPARGAGPRKGPPDRKGKRPERGGRGGKGSREDDRRRGKRSPIIHEQKAKRAPEPKIDPDLPEDEQFRLKLERLRRKFERGQ